jgi:hypothetical protein
LSTKECFSQLFKADLDPSFKQSMITKGSWFVAQNFFSAVVIFMSASQLPRGADGYRFTQRIADLNERFSKTSHAEATEEFHFLLGVVKSRPGPTSSLDCDSSPCLSTWVNAAP